MYRRPEIKLERTGEPTDSTGVSPIMYEVVLLDLDFRRESRKEAHCSMCFGLVYSDIIVLCMVFNLSAARNINILSAAPRTKNRNLSLTDHDEPTSRHRFGP
jgi:hypothetical protein